MSCTNFYFAISNKCVSFMGDVKCIRYSGEEEKIISSIIGDATSSTLVLAILDPKENGRVLKKTLCTQFSENFVTPQGGYTQFTISFIDESVGDVLDYRCNRLSDIEAIIEEESQHKCCSLHASVVQPTSSSFVFSDVRLTLMIWNEEQYGNDLVLAVERVATLLGTRINSICVYFASGEVSFVDRCINMTHNLRRSCQNKLFGEDERISSQIRLKDVRAWSVFLNEFYRFAPQSEGPYFINLNPRLTVGEKLAHAISQGVSYIVAESGNSSFADIVVFPLNGTKGEFAHRSIYSPHCRIKYEDNIVYIRPECGMTYINGELLSSEIPLHHNDRIILGTDMVFRFVMVETKPVTSSSSKILDWELCCKEFEYVTSNNIKEAEYDSLEKELYELKEDYERLQRQLQLERGTDDKIWLILNNPPSDYNSNFIWHLGWMKLGDSITLGPQGNITLPFLKSTAVITRKNDGFTYSCDSVTLRLSHSDRIVNGDSIFTICLQSTTSATKKFSKKEVDGLRELEPFSENDIREVRISLFELQWSIALLFDFAFPLDKERTEDLLDDPFHLRRIQIGVDNILNEKRLKLQDIVNLTERMTETIRMISAQLSNEVYSNFSSLKREDIAINGEGLLTKEILNQIKGETELSYDLLSRVQHSVGRALIEGETQEFQNRLHNLPPLKIKGLGTHVYGNFRSQIMEIKGKFFIASPAVIRRMSSVLETISASSDPRALWERYLKILDTLLKPNIDISILPTSKKQNLALALVDVLVALDYNVRNGFISTEEEEGTVEKRLPYWMTISDTCLEVFKKSVDQKRGVFRGRDATTQRRPTPNLRHTSPASRSVVKKTTSRPGTPRSTNGGPIVSPKSKHLSSSQGVDSIRHLSSTGKSPRGLRSLTPTGLNPRPGNKPFIVRSTPASPRIAEKVGKATLKSGITIHRTLGSTTVIGAARTTQRGGTRNISPTTTLLRGVKDNTKTLRKRTQDGG